MSSSSQSASSTAAAMSVDKPQQSESEQQQQKQRKVEVVSSAGEKSATLVLWEEDHTLGNALRYLLAKDRQTAFVGYSMPHPSEPKVNMRLQAHDGSAVVLFEKGLDNLSSVCDHILDTFETQCEEFIADQQSA